MPNNFHLGECEPCSAWRPLKKVTACGLETMACAICRGGDPLDLFEEFGELYDQQAERLMSIIDKADV